MNIGLIGLPGAGKTSVFNALTGADAPVAGFGGGKLEPNVGIIRVEDERVDRLSEIYAPKKTVHATVQFIDYIIPAGSRSGMFSGEGLNLLKRADALAVVLRNFGGPDAGDGTAPPTPVSDLQTLFGELIIADLLVVDTRLERIAVEKKKTRPSTELQVEERALRKLHETLDAERPASEAQLDEMEDKAVRGMQLLSRKPLFGVLNSADDRFGNNDALLAEIGPECELIEFAGAFEMELSGLDPEEAEEFMQEIGIEQSARARLTTFAYRKLGYISFFTVGDDEVRAWTIRAGSTAVDAAGAIHSDLAKGFIRAECFTYNDIVELGTEARIKQQGKLRLEGKTYTVCDGDILNIRFSV